MMPWGRLMHSQVLTAITEPMEQITQIQPASNADLDHIHSYTYGAHDVL